MTNQRILFLVTANLSPPLTGAAMVKADLDVETDAHNLVNYVCGINYRIILHCIYESNVVVHVLISSLHHFRV